MGGLFKQFKTDGNVEKEGLWLEYGTADGSGQPIRILIARAGGANVAFQKAFERHSKPFKRLIQIGQMEDEQSKRMMRNVYADSVIKGWENVEDENDQPLEFNRENVIHVLTELPDLFVDIVEQANKGALFRQDLLEADSGN